MCGRYALHHNPDVIALQFGIGMLPPFEARFNIAPSTNVLIVREDHEKGRTADLYRWGLIPGWAKDPIWKDKPAYRNVQKSLNDLHALSQQAV